MAARTRWIPIHVRLGDPASHAAMVATLVDAGAEGVQDADDTLITYLPEDTDLTALRLAVQRSSPRATMEVGAALSGNWTEMWAPRVGVQRVGALVIAPPWLASAAASDDGLIVIDPAMAFGTGEHPTTRGVLRLMQQVIAPGDVVADLGAGSAVLAIAAARLGAARVAAIEMDPDAIGNAEENVVRNDVGDRVKVVHGDAAVLLPLVAPVQLLLANILSSVLVQLSPIMRAALAPGGTLIASGILAVERDDFLRAMSVDGWRPGAEDREGDWWSTLLTQR
jgi:ribosomal protein L11 methyltransferase